MLFLSYWTDTAFLSARSLVFGPKTIFPPPLVPTCHFHILCKICEHIYRQRLLLAQGGGGGRYAIKLFPISICFIVRKHSFCPKLSPCSIPKGKLIQIS